MSSSWAYLSRVFGVRRCWSTLTSSSGSKKSWICFTDRSQFCIFFFWTSSVAFSWLEQRHVWTLSSGGETCGEEGVVFSTTAGSAKSAEIYEHSVDHHSSTTIILYHIPQSWCIQNILVNVHIHEKVTFVLTLDHEYGCYSRCRLNKNHQNDL